MTITEAIAQCKATGLAGWPLVEYAQRLVAGAMEYSWFNSFDMPDKAFEKGQGYCWQQAGALNLILKGLGLDSRLVHAIRNSFPETIRDGVTLPAMVSGHVWCRVQVDGQEKNVCPGRESNRPSVMHFKPLSKVKSFKGPIVVFSYLGSAAINQHRGKKFMELKKKQIALHNPELCPCKKANCPRHANCKECMANHYGNGSKPTCER